MKATGIGMLYGGLMIPFVYQLAEASFPGRSPKKIMLKTLLSCGMLSTGGNWLSLFARRVLGAPHDDESLHDRVLRCCDSVNAIFHNVILDDLKIWPLCTRAPVQLTHSLSQTHDDASMPAKAPYLSASSRTFQVCFFAHAFCALSTSACTDDLLCFTLVPPQLRPTATAVVSVCWHTYVSLIAARSHRSGLARRET